MLLATHLRSYILPLEFRLIASSILLLIAGMGTALSQEATALRSTFLDSLEVNVVNVEVFATDKKGNLLL
ncbi:MAG: hypothetical protein V3S30_03135, partial [Thermoanaerobaculia bacterium]